VFNINFNNISIILVLSVLAGVYLVTVTSQTQNHW